MKKIFINYRRDDVGVAALLVYKRLDAKYPGNVFMDLEGGIPLGDDYEAAILAGIGNCDVLLAFMDKQWVGAAQGKRRIDDPQDWVRRELQHAMHENKKIIPVLFNGAPEMEALELPASLKPLEKRNSVSLSLKSFEGPYANLEAHITEALKAASDKRSEGAAQRQQAAAAAPQTTASIAVEPYLAKLAIMHSCWRRPDQDDRFGGTPMYQIHVMLLGESAALDLVTHVDYTLDPSYPQPHRTEADASRNFGFYELANGHSIVVAAVHIRGATEPLYLNRFINMTADGPRLNDLREQFT